MIKDDTVEVCGCVRIMSWFLVDTEALGDCKIQRRVSKHLMRQAGMGLTGASNNTHCEPFPSPEFGQYSSQTGVSPDVSK